MDLTSSLSRDLITSKRNIEYERGEDRVANAPTLLFKECRNLYFDS